MKKFLVGVFLSIAASAFCQAPFGNYISIGPNGYLVNTDTALAPGSSQIPVMTLPITVECFFKMSGLTGDHAHLFGFGPGMLLGVSSGSELRYNYLSTSSTWTSSGLGIPSYNFLQWSHLAVEVYYSGGLYWMSIGINGDCIVRQEINASFMNVFQNGSFVRFFIGHDFHPFLSYGQGLHGFMDELRYSNNSRYGLYWPGPGVYTVPTNEFVTDANTRLLLHFNELPGATVAHDTTGSNRDFLIRNDAFISGPPGIYTSNGFVDYDTVCYGSQIFAQGGNQVTWTPSIGLSGNVWNPTILMDDTLITYIANIVDLNTGVTGVDTITLFIPPRPHLGNDTSTCYGPSITLLLDSMFLPLMWSNGSTNVDLLIDTTGSYFVHTYGYGCTQADTMNFTTTILSNLDLGNDTSICIGGTLLLNVGSVWDSVTWWNGSNDTLQLISSPGNYFAQVTDSSDCLSFDTIHVATYSAMNFDLGNDISICLNDTILLNAGSEWTSILWWDATNDTIHPVSMPGSYFAEVVDSNACIYSDTVVVAGDFLLSVDLGNDTSLCYNGSVSYNLGNLWSAITWWDGSNDSVNVIPATTGTYFVETMDQYACEHYDTIMVTAYPLQNLDLGNDTSICANDSVFLNVGNSWSVITWWDANTDTMRIITTIGNYFVEVIDGNSCYYHDTIAITNNPVNISGFAYSSDLIPLINTPVYFVLADTSNYIISLDSVITDATGFFSINTQLFDFSILVKPDSTFYPNQMPTYYDTSVTIQNSTFFNLNACDSVSIDIYSVPGINPGGPCFVGGTIIYGGRAVNGDPVPGIKVIFVDASDNILGYTYTDAQGYFYMNNLPSGDIRFWVDWPEIDNTLAPMLTLSPTTNYINVYFELYPDQLIILASSIGIDPSSDEDMQVSVYPNPVTENITIKLPSGESGALNIINYLGASVLTQNLNDASTINLRNLSTGVYFVTIRIGDKQIVRKIIKI